MKLEEMRLVNALGRAHLQKVDFQLYDQYRIITVGNCRYAALRGRAEVSIPSRSTLIWFLIMDAGSDAD